MSAQRQGNSKARNTGGNSPLKTRVFVLAVVLCCGIAGVVSLFDRKELPTALRDSPYVEAAYRLRDKTLQKGEELMHKAPEEPSAEAKQKGYETEDRKKLEKLISKGAND